MTRLKLHLDADASSRPLFDALVNRGHDVTRTPCAWMLLDATDEEQLLGATSQERCVFTFNIRNFLALAEAHPDHCGIILAAQRRWSLTNLIVTLDRALSHCEGEELAGQVRWLNDWRPKP